MSVLVMMERAGDAWRRLSLETLAAAQQMGAELGLPVAAAAFGGQATELAAWKLDKVYRIECAANADCTAAVTALIAHCAPTLVLFPHTYATRDYAPRVAARLGVSMVGDVVRHRVEAGELILVRQLFQGKLNADYRFTGGIRVASIQAGAYRAETLVAGTAPVESFAADVAAGAQAGARYREASRAVDLTAAEKIVAVGRGIRDQANIALAQELASELGAELGASRPICDNGWLPMERQVGSSGQTVAPKLYIAAGISGAIQHMVGMKGSKVIVAINQDAGAPIFEVADYAITGDVLEVLPAITAAVRKSKA